MKKRRSLTVRPNAALALAGRQALGSVANAGHLATGSAIEATTIDSPGSVELGGRITTTGNQVFGGAVVAAAGNAAPALIAGDDATISATNEGNDFGAGALALSARSVQLVDGGPELALGALIRARLPYSVSQRPNSQLPALTVNTALASSGGGFGSVQQPIGLFVDSVNAATGIGGLFLTVFPAPQPGVVPTQQIFLGCQGCASVPVYQFGGDPAAVQAYS